jgi:hypothetical protein
MSFCNRFLRHSYQDGCRVFFRKRFVNVDFALFSKVINYADNDTNPRIQWQPDTASLMQLPW